MNLRRAVVVTIAFGVVFVFGAAARAQNSAASGDAMSALLNEVHALRVAMEQQATVVPRIQLSLARLNIEEQRLLESSALMADEKQTESSPVLAAIGAITALATDCKIEVERVVEKK